MIKNLANNSLLVTQDNALISASYSLSLAEKRLLVLALSKIDPTSKVWLNGGSATVTATEWSKHFDLDVKSSYKRLRSASDSLYGKSVMISGDAQDGERIRWLSSEKYSQGDGFVTLKFGREMVHYISGMVDQFTSYELLSVSGLKSSYSVRVYELARQFLNTGWRYIDLKDFRVMLELENRYPVWTDLRKRVLDRACNEINKKSDLILSYKIIKKGRSVHAIKLTVDKKIQSELKFDF